METFDYAAHRLAAQIDDTAFSKALNVWREIKGLRKFEVQRLLEIESPSEFSHFLHGHRAWPLDLKARAIVRLPKFRSVVTLFIEGGDGTTKKEAVRMKIQ